MKLFYSEVIQREQQQRAEMIENLSTGFGATQSKDAAQKAQRFVRRLKRRQ